jgi:hypothetical protein
MLLHKMLHAKWKCSKYQIIVFCLTRPDRVSNSRFTTIEARKENIRASWINLGTFTLIDQGFEFWNWGYNCCFFLNFVPLHIESPYNFGGTGPILEVKKTSAEGKWACWIRYNKIGWKYTFFDIYTEY